ncbi:uncharacterized protein LOC124358619 [Homalodisca vitripennis]|uniref:uncharacterized protein LOC124358619 n=1 Tax=Homalodisca vitripennis TaxID=197043 RepID=UPI001EEA1A58|nr:uncharacterized protein LOC124358619 [Homalodisca vitripennis]
MVAHCLCVVLAIYLFSHFWGIGAQDSGPYRVILESIRDCTDKGTGEMSITSSSRTDESGKMYHTGDLNMPYGLKDNNFKAEGDASIWKGGEWKPIGLVWKLGFPKACSSIKSMVPTWFDILKAAGVENLGCMIPQGKYHFVDYHVGSMDKVNSLKYGKYRIRLSFTRQGKKIGCISYFAQAVPK